MIALWAAAGVALALVAQLALGRVLPGAVRYVDFLYLPIAAYALRRSQRSAMTVGCVAGLLQDYWTEPRLFGINGLVKTVLGWGVGGVGARFDLNNSAGRFAVGASLSLLDDGLQAAVRRLFSDAAVPVSLATLGVRALTGGLLAAGVLYIVGRAGNVRRKPATPARRKV